MKHKVGHKAKPSPSDQVPVLHRDLDLWRAVADWPRLPLGSSLHRWFAASLDIHGDHMIGGDSLRAQARRFWCVQICGRSEAFLDSLLQGAGPEGPAAFHALVGRISKGAPRPSNVPSLICSQATLLDQLVLAELFPMLALLNPVRHDTYWTSDPPGRLKEFRERHVLPLLKRTRGRRGAN